jgi:hypothetical protein
MERRTAVVVRSQAPAGALIRQQVHMKNRATAAGADHRGLFFEAILLHDIQLSTIQFCRKFLINNDRGIRRYQPLKQIPPSLPDLPADYRE